MFHQSHFMENSCHSGKTFDQVTVTSKNDFSSLSDLCVSEDSNQTLFTKTFPIF